MGLGEIIGVLIFAIIINIWLWHSGFYSGKKKEIKKEDIKYQFDGKIYDTQEEVISKMIQKAREEEK